MRLIVLLLQIVELVNCFHFITPCDPCFRCSDLFATGLMGFFWGFVFDYSKCFEKNLAVFVYKTHGGLILLTVFP